MSGTTTITTAAETKEAILKQAKSLAASGVAHSAAAAANPSSLAQQVQNKKQQEREECLRKWHKDRTTMDEMLKLMQVCVETRFENIAVDLFESWSPPTLDHVSIFAIYHLLNWYAMALFQCRRFEQALNVYRLCTEAQMRNIVPNKEAALQQRLKQKKGELKQPSLLLTPFVPRDPKDPVLAQLTQLAGNVPRVIDKLLEIWKPKQKSQVRPISTLEKLVGGGCKTTQLLLEEKERPEGYVEMNPSIWIDRKKHPDQLWINLRLVSFRLTDDNRYVGHPTEGTNTRNFLLSTPAQSLCSTGEQKLVKFAGAKEVVSTKATFPFPAVRGWEDVRLIGPSTGDMWIMFHSFEYHKSRQGQNQLRVFIAPIDLQTGKIKHDPLRVTGWGEHMGKQKNWMPFWWRKSLFFIYSWCPLLVLHCPTRVETEGKCPDDAKTSCAGHVHVQVASLDLPMILNEWHGSAPPLELPLVLSKQLPNYQPGFIYFLFHVHNADFPLYSRRLGVFALEPHSPTESWRHPFRLKITHLTEEFQFRDNSTIEFSLGMTLHGTDLLLGYSVRDSNALLTRLSWAQVLSLLLAV